MDKNEYKIGNTKVFFKAGVLGMLEDMRDERLSKIVSLFQAWIRGYLMRKQYKKLQDQRYSIIGISFSILSDIKDLDFVTNNTCPKIQR